MRRAIIAPVSNSTAAVASATSAAATVTAAQRSVYTIWGTVPHEGPNVHKPNDQIPTLQKVFSPSGTRFWRLMTVPAVEKATLPAEVNNNLSGPEEYLLSGIEDDLKRIQAVDWTVEFDSFWADRVYSHEQLFNTLYTSNCNGSWGKMIFSDCSMKDANKEYVGARLALLQATLKWAQETERHYSVIARARFDMQRKVFDALEREKILAGVIVMVNDFKSRVPAEFARKATMDLEFHVNNLRHWVWDAPNAKMAFPRDLA